ncbi:MOSC domain-containing protein [Sulfitobacter sp. MF3-043]|uniref:MOSC domain-containing protein n=1 Tax=Sulfitobacter sediminivivens TaxID=3252902 RepID=UPI0036DCC11D
MQIIALYRHPLKSHGREALQTVTLHAGQSMPFDRNWAVAHDASKADGSTWAPCQNFSRGSKAPALMAINAVLDEQSGGLTLSHPDRPDLTFDPNHEADIFLKWVKPLVPQDRALPDRILRLSGRGFTDSDYASISLCNTASHAAVSEQAGADLSPLRWRGNIWFEGEAPWQEMDWIGKEIALGAAKLSIREPIQRCLATTANPETGARDVDTLGILNSTWDHQNFGIYAEVIKGGPVALGDSLTVH